MVDFKLLSKYKISYSECIVAKSQAQAVASANKIGFPVAMKIISPSILHKTDRGGVLLGIGNAEEASSSFGLLMRRFASAKPEGVLVQKMAPHGGVELIMGGKRDAQFGQLIMFGVGGIFVEIFKDVSLRVCPITREDAKEMIHSLRAYPLLAGARGRKPVNEEAVISTLLKVSDLLTKENPSEFDLNPVIADDKGCIAVDIRLLK